jgi:hypothetical protein
MLANGLPHSPNLLLPDRGAILQSADSSDMVRAVAARVGSAGRA